MNNLEISSETNNPKDTDHVAQPLGSTALFFLAPKVTISPYETTIFVIENEEEATAVDPSPSFATSREDYQLLRRHQRSMRNRTARRGKNHR